MVLKATGGRSGSIPTGAQAEEAEQFHLRSQTADPVKLDVRSDAAFRNVDADAETHP